MTARPKIQPLQSDLLETPLFLGIVPPAPALCVNVHSALACSGAPMPFDLLLGSRPSPGGQARTLPSSQFHVVKCMAGMGPFPSPTGSGASAEMLWFPHAPSLEGGG